uniref:ATP synthase complex subunit 8 n=1 Tax=Roisinitermes ebogoensis TaxID=2483479 RepID=A0A3G2SEH1_9NEOP|nr:ATP synthase F0 subunit 8 [Roisinitermes ebogoensis]AYO45649.1 ATP synthase F0 subunit 8 [Roisinitermes ebogoensis]URX52854.1 ATP synthase F0 subunit 8 [Roisinitermes ebogoensis]
MPQMMPMGWVILFIMFSTTLIIFASMNYYTWIPKSKYTLKKTVTKNSINWKW